VLEKLQHFVTDPKKELLLFTQAQYTLFLKNALPLLNTNYSIGVVGQKIIDSSGLTITSTTITGEQSLGGIP